MSETDCTEILIEIEAFVDGEIQAVRYEEIEAHLRLCTPCLDRADFRQKLKDLVSSKCCSESVPEPLAEKIRTLLSEA